MLGQRRYDNFECGGHRYILDFRQGGRGYRVDVWLDRAIADPEVLAETRAILNSLELTATE